MSGHPSVTVAEYNLAECSLIAAYAYERFVDVSPLAVFRHLEVWRLWYYGMVPDQAVISLPGVRRVTVSGR